MQIRVSDGDDVTFYYSPNDYPTDDKDEEEDESPSQRIVMADDDDDDKVNDQDLGSVDNTTTTIEKLKMKEIGIQLLKLMWGEFVAALCHIGRSRSRTMKSHHEY